MLVISSSVVLDQVNSDPDLPLVGYDNIVTTTNIAATTEETGYPVTRLANPETHLEWRGASTATHYITITTDGVTDTEYIGVVGHNWGTDGATVSVEAYISSVWTVIEGPNIFGNDEPIMWRIDPRPENLRIKIVPVSLKPKAAVVQAGALLVMERKIYSRHVPINYGFKTRIANGFSESGRFTGRVVLGETRESVASFRLITPDWFRENMPDFLRAAQSAPFFFVWRPNSYPEEVGYVVLADDVAPAPEDPGSNNLIAFDLKLEGVAA